MKHLNFIGLFERFARQHIAIKHGSGGRFAFFRMNKESEMILALNSLVSFPCLLVQDVSGSLKRAGDIQDNMVAVFEIRGHIEPNDFDGIEALREQCKEIGFQIIALIDDIFDDMGYCGPIHDFDMDQVQWEFTGPINQNEYGCQFRFPFSNTAYNPYTIHLDDLFIDEHYAHLIDFDGEELVDFDGQYLTELE
jgi:hypothetical protein